MSNMGYCRFENTACDLREVIENWDSLDNDSNDEEHEAKERIIEMAKEIIDMERTA